MLLRTLGVQEGLQACPCAFQVVDPGGGEVFVARAPDGAGHPVIHKHVTAQDVFRFHRGSVRDLRPQLSPGVFGSVQRQQVDLGVIFVSVVHLPVEMDGHVRDQDRVPLKIDQFAFQSVCCPDDHPPGDGQRSVEPGRQDSAAILFNIQTYIVLAGILKTLLQLQCGRIRVGRHEPEGRHFILRYAERDQG